MSILKEGTLLNREQYKITKMIGQGGFGITYLAEEIGYFKNTGFGEEYKAYSNPEIVVIKELFYDDICTRDNLTGLITISNLEKKKEFEKLVKNQLDEGKTIRGLKHKNIVRTRDIFEENNTAYMVMDYIESTDVEKILEQSGAISKDKSLKYIFQILDAVDYIHTKADKKILHLDISPSNILINKKNDDAILIDFGSALSYDTIQNKITSTTSQIVTGRKRHYSPNEQADIDQLKSFDATFDTYAIGATLYHMLSGEKPPLSSLISSGKEKVLPPSHFGKDNSISDYLDEVVLKAISFWYPNRFKSVQDFSQSLIKEKEYIKKIAEVNKWIANKNLDEAYKEINLTKEYFLETPTIKSMLVNLNNELEKNRKQKEFDVFFEQGLELLAKDKYQLAKDYFEKANAIFPDNANVMEKISFCNDKLNEDKIDLLFIEFHNACENVEVEKAKSILNDIKLIAPANSNIAIFQKKIVTLENEKNFSENFSKAQELFQNKDFENALYSINEALKYDSNDLAITLKDKIKSSLEKTIVSLPTIKNETNEDTILTTNNEIEEEERLNWVSLFKNNKKIIFIVSALLFSSLIAFLIFNNKNTVPKPKSISTPTPVLDSSTITKKDSTSNLKNQEPVASKLNSSLTNKLQDDKTKESANKKQIQETKVKMNDVVSKDNPITSSDKQIDYDLYNKKMHYAKELISSLNNLSNSSEAEKEPYKKYIKIKLNEALKAKPNDAEATRLLKQYE